MPDRDMNNPAAWSTIRQLPEKSMYDTTLKIAAVRMNLLRYVLIMQHRCDNYAHVPPPAAQNVLRLAARHMIASLLSDGQAGETSSTYSYAAG